MVGLFAALAFIMSDGTRGGAKGLTEQQARLVATEILNYTSSMKRAVQQLQINGCSDEQIDFGNNIYKNAITGLDLQPVGANTAAPSDGSCGVYHQNGAGLRPIIFDLPDPTPSGTSTTSGHFIAGTFRTVIGVGGNDTDLETSVGTAGLGKEICIEMNDLLGVTNPSGNPPTETTMPIIGDEATELVGKMAFCYLQNTTNPRYVFNQILIAR